MRSRAPGRRALSALGSVASASRARSQEPWEPEPEALQVLEEAAARQSGGLTIPGTVLCPGMPRVCMRSSACTAGGAGASPSIARTQTSFAIQLSQEGTSRPCAAALSHAPWLCATPHPRKAALRAVSVASQRRSAGSRGTWKSVGGPPRARPPPRGLLRVRPAPGRRRHRRGRRSAGTSCRGTASPRARCPRCSATNRTRRAAAPRCGGAAASRPRNCCP